MPNNYFKFKQFTINQDKSAFKVGTDGVLIGACANVSEAVSILDIGSGTGLISLMLAQRCNAIITAIEPDHDSYLQILENVELCKWKDRIKVVHTDLQNFNPAGKFDLIVTNPPYFSNSLKNPDPRKSASRHTDSLSLEELMTGVIRLMNDNGRFQIIMPYVEGNVLIAEAQHFGLFCNSILKIRPLPTSEIRRLVLAFSKERLPVTEKFLTIEHGPRHDFTNEYIDLTKDFYLKF